VEAHLSALALSFDILLAATLVALAWRLVTSDDLFGAAVLFIVFGLFTALAWVRLRAPDVAMAEAAIGAGLSGALVLAAVARLQGLPRPAEGSTSSSQAEGQGHEDG
jgi:energy-converting hydrogenase B subunit D